MMLFQKVLRLGLRRFTSALYLSGEQPQTHQPITPQLDLDKKLEDADKLLENVQLRKMTIDPVQLKSLYEFLKNLEATKVQLEKRRVEIADQMKDLKKIGNDSEARQEMEKLKIEGRVVREDLKTLMKAFWEVEEKVMLKGLSLPNELHKMTPEVEDKVVCQFLERPHVNQVKNHLELAEERRLVVYKNPSCCYLTNSAVAFELGLLQYFSTGLKQESFLLFCNPDFARSAVVEGCGTNHSDPGSVLILKEDTGPAYRLHLVGGASMYPFCAYHAKHTIDFSSLPLKYFATGRQYGPSIDDEDGLFGVWQKSCAEVFALTPDDEVAVTKLFDETIAHVTNLYKHLGYHFRVVYLSAESLYTWESLRASFQMYSCHKQKYLEVGRLSLSGSYICQRMDMSYTMSATDTKSRWPRMLTGTVIDVARVLGCALEQLPAPDAEFHLPVVLKPYTLGLV